MPGPVPIDSAMPQDTVAIEIPAATDKQLLATVRSCSLVLGDGLCRRHDTPGPTAAYWATVVWEDAEQRTATVTLRTTGTEVSIHREVRFAPEDPLEQRYRALGLLIVSQVITTAAQQRHADSQEPVPATTPNWGLDLGMLSGPGLDTGAWRWGGLLRGWSRLPSSALGLYASASYAVRLGVTEVGWLTGSVGVLGHWTLRDDWAFETRFGGIAQQVSLIAESPVLGSESAQLLRFGGQLEADVLFQFSDGFSCFAGAWGRVVGPRFVVEVENEHIGAGAPFTWGLNTGVRVSQ